MTDSPTATLAGARLGLGLGRGRGHGGRLELLGVVVDAPDLDLVVGFGRIVTLYYRFIHFMPYLLIYSVPLFLK